MELERAFTFHRSFAESTKLTIETIVHRGVGSLGSAGFVCQCSGSILPCAHFFYATSRMFDLISQPFIVSIDVHARRARVEHFITWIHYESHCVCRLVNPLSKYLLVMYLSTWARWLRRGWRNLRFWRILITRTWPSFNQRHKNLSSSPAFGLIETIYGLCLIRFEAIKSPNPAYSAEKLSKSFELFFRFQCFNLLKSWNR